MIIHLPATTTGLINKELVDLRLQGGVVALGRVMTLIVDATGTDAETAIATANVTSREHPCRIIVLAPESAPSASLDAEIRVGGDAGAAEVIVLRPSGEMVDHADTLVIPLLLPDVPIVAWWPGPVPSNPMSTGIGQMATRRVTDSKGAANVDATLADLADNYAPGDTDIAWARVTRWRALLASALDQMSDATVTRASIHGDTGSPSIILLAAWLHHTTGCTVDFTYDDAVEGLQSVTLDTTHGLVSITRIANHNAVLRQPGQPDHTIALPRRSLADCLSEDLRRLDADEVYGETLAAVSALAAQ